VAPEQLQRKLASPAATKSFTLVIRPTPATELHIRPESSIHDPRVAPSDPPEPARRRKPSPVSALLA